MGGGGRDINSRFNGQIRDVVMNEGEGRMHGVDKMDAEANSEEGKTGNLERCGLG